MENQKTFKTKTGFCHILNDKIILTKHKDIENILEKEHTNEIGKVLIIYSVLVILFFYYANLNFQNGDVFPALLYCSLGTLLLIGIIKSKNNSTVPVIERSKIKQSEFKTGKKGLTRSRFEIMFEDENGKIKKRLIMLPGSLNNGNIETEKALVIMKSEKLMSLQN
jgi:hypothetical protein